MDRPEKKELTLDDIWAKVSSVLNETAPYNCSYEDVHDYIKTILKAAIGDENILNFEENDLAYKIGTHFINVSIPKKRPHSITIDFGWLLVQFEREHLTDKTIREGILTEVINSFYKAKYKAELKSKVDELAVSAQKQVDEAVENLTTSYTEKLAIEAPKEYWDKKSSDHSKFAIYAEEKFHKYSWQVVFLLLSIVFFIVIYPQLISLSQDYFQFPTGLILFMGSIVATAVMFVSAVVRNQYRRMHEERHYSYDAKERAVMVETYNAMSAHGLVTDKDRSKIINALFSPAQRITHSNEPFTPIEVIAKFGEKVKASTSKTGS